MNTCDFVEGGGGCLPEAGTNLVYIPHTQSSQGG